jgi:glyceraldehyde 3-phosphate dehydrogenase
MSAMSAARLLHVCDMPMQLDYASLGVQQVWECTGVFLTRAALQPYFDKGVPKVVVSAPVKDPNPVLNVVMGCNDVSGPRTDHRAAGSMGDAMQCNAMAWLEQWTL